MYKLVAKARAFKAVSSSLLSAIEEATLRIRKDGIFTNTLDASTKEMVGFLWSKEKFSTYEVEFGDAEFVDLTISVKDFNTACKRFEDDVDLTIVSINESKAVQITDGKKEFVCMTINYQKEFAKEIKTAYPSSFDIDIKQLIDMKEDSDVFGLDAAWLISEDGKLKFEGKEATGHVKGILLENYDQQISNTGFSFGFLTPFLNTVKAFVDPKLKMELGPQMPLHLILTIPEVTDIHFFLAPMIN